MSGIIETGGEALVMAKPFKRKREKEPKPDPEQTKDRIHLLMSNLEKLAFYWMRAAEQGQSNEAMVVIDLRDPLATGIVRDSAWAREQSEAALADHKIPTAFLAFRAVDLAERLETWPGMTVRTAPGHERCQGAFGGR